jgi:hypothetical protein
MTLDTSFYLTSFAPVAADRAPGNKLIVRIYRDITSRTGIGLNPSDGPYLVGAQTWAIVLSRSKVEPSDIRSGIRDQSNVDCLAARILVGQPVVVIGVIVGTDTLVRGIGILLCLCSMRREKRKNEK